MTEAGRTPSTVVGRYALHDELATGGMASIHIGRLLGPVGFARTVVIKRLHPQFAKDPDFVSMFVDEARVAARIRHPNVVQTLDVVATRGELFLVMDYVQGESLSRLLRTARADDVVLPVGAAVAIGVGILHGLHAAHEAKSERGEPLHIVHRDVSPQNVIVGTDGVPRVLDFGVAKAAGRVHNTRDGTVKGKLAYMAPEQLAGTVSRQSDVFAASIVLWEALTGARLFDGSNEGEILTRVVSGPIQAPSTFNPAVSPQLDAVVLRGLERDATKRFATAREMAVALERLGGVTAASDLGEWVERVAHRELARRAELITAIETETDSSQRPLELGRELRDEPTKRTSVPEKAPVDDDAPTLAQHTPSRRTSTGASTSASSASTPKPVAEDPSSASIASASAPPAPFARAPKRRAVLVVPLALVAVACLAVIVLSVAKRWHSDDASNAGGPSTPATSSPSSTATGPKTTVEPSISAIELPTNEPAPSSTPSTIATASPPPAPAPTPTPAPTPKPTTTSLAIKPPPAKPTTTGAAKPSASPKPDCNPKYTIDAKGVKVWKPECF